MYPQVVMVMSNKAEADGIKWAAAMGIHTEVRDNSVYLFTLYIALITAHV